MMRLRTCGKSGAMPERTGARIVPLSISLPNRKPHPMTDQKKKENSTKSSAKNIVLKPITPASAARIVRRYHYSGKVVPNSQIHIGVFLEGRCEGALQFGPPMDKRKTMGLVADTRWNGFIELNRMAFSDRLPRNSESRALAVALRMIKKHYPHIEWILSFADATQCGDGTIYRAAGFDLTGIKKNRSIIRLADGTVTAAMTVTKRQHIVANGGRSRIPEGAEQIKGFQLRYIYFLNPAARTRLVVPILPYSEIDKAGAGMYKGQARAKHSNDAAGVPPRRGRGRTDPPAPSRKSKG